MTVYYNEIDLYAAQWLRNSIKKGLIADGEVDTRSIVDVRPRDLVAFKQCHFFAGLGGWSGALRLAGFPDDRPVWSGSCPCQPFSLAGKQKGFADDRHLWPCFRDLIRECRPAKVYGEQVASAAQWLGLVRGDLEALGYAVGAIPIEAASAGADHLRDRFWFVGNALGQGELQPQGAERAERRWLGDAGHMGDACRAGLSLGSIAEIERGDVRHEGAPFTTAGHRGAAMADSIRLPIRIEPRRGSGPRGTGAREHRDDSEISWVIGADGKARRVKSGIRLLAYGVPARVAKLRALGNAIDLRPAAAFIKATM